VCSLGFPAKTARRADFWATPAAKIAGLAPWTALQKSPLGLKMNLGKYPKFDEN